jgi:hypothetical protein
MIDEALVVHTLAARGIAPDDSQRAAIAAILALLASRGPRGVYRAVPAHGGYSLVTGTRQTERTTSPGHSAGSRRSSHPAIRGWGRLLE